jgi:hypothetical protein
MMATLKELLGREPTGKEQDDLYNSLNKIVNPFPSTCEYEHRNETRAIRPDTTDKTQYTLYVHYTCGCYYCAYPKRECRVKQP